MSQISARKGVFWLTLAIPYGSGDAELIGRLCNHEPLSDGVVASTAFRQLASRLIQNPGTRKICRALTSGKPWEQNQSQSSR